MTMNIPSAGELLLLGPFEQRLRQETKNKLETQLAYLPI